MKRSGASGRGRGAASAQRLDADHGRRRRGRRSAGRRATNSPRSSARVEVAVELEALDDARVHPARRLDDAALAARLGRVHRDVGVAEQLVGRVARRAQAMPMLAPTAMLGARRSSNGARARRGSARRPRAPRRRPPSSSSRTANSSPPRRAAVSCARRPSQAAGDRRSSSSPAAWPRLSLTVLKSSRSMNRTATRRCRGGARAPGRASRRSSNSARFGSPVSASWKAWWRSWSSSALRSVTSRRLSRMPSTAGRRARFSAITSTCGRPPSAVAGAGFASVAVRLERVREEPQRAVERRRGARRSSERRSVEVRGRGEDVLDGVGDP